MPTTDHTERHFLGSETVRDVVIGMSDGLTVPFALAAGLSGAVDTTAIVVTAGLAEVAAGAVAMGLGGYLAARSDAEHYHAEERREWREVHEVPHIEEAELYELFDGYGIERVSSAPVVAALRARPTEWVDFMMRFELGLERPDPKRAYTSAATIGGAYIAGGMIPLAPYFAFTQASSALPVSVVLTLIALAVFGFFKGRFTGAPALRSSAQTVLVGGLAASIAFALAKVVG